MRPSETLESSGTYYKIVSVSDNRYFSLIARYDDIKVEYKLDEYVYPTIKNSKLCLFNRLSSARDFLWNQKNSPDIEIFECKVLSPECLNIYNLQCVRYTDIKDWIRVFWKNQYNVPSMYRSNWPSGTILCDAIKLIKKID